MPISEVLSNLPGLGRLFTRAGGGAGKRGRTLENDPDERPAGPEGRSGFALSCEDYEALFQYSREATFILDHKGIIALANPACCQLFGCEKGELAGMDGYSLLHGEERAKFRGVAPTISIGRVFSETARAVTKDGRTIVIEVRGSAVRLQQEGYFVATVRDVTARMRADRALEASERRFRDIAELTADRFWETDMNQRYTFLTSPSPNEASLSGVPAEMIGMSRYELLRRIGADASIADEIAGCMKRGEVFTDLPLRYEDPERGEVWVKVSGRPILDAAGKTIGYRGISRACTEELRQQRAVEDNRRKLAAIVENAPVGVCLKNADGTYELVNETLSQMFGRSKDSIIGKAAASILPSRFARLFQSEDEVVFSSGKAVSFETRFERPNGEHADLDIVKFPVLSDDGTVVQVGSIVRDVTRQKESERHSRRAAKMESMGEFTAGIVHEFNNLLAVVMGNGDIILDSPDADDEISQAAGEIIAAAERGADLTSQLLIFSRRQTTVSAVQDPNRVIRDMMPLLRRSLGEHIEIELDLAKSLNQVDVNQSQLERCLVGLAGNARDAMPRGGRLTFETRNYRVPRGGREGSLGLAPGDYACIIVRDEGCGMSEDIANRAFDPFFTTKDVGAGQGLGLSMAYGFVDQLGGRIEIDSNESEGTSVTLYLPAAKTARTGGRRVNGRRNNAESMSPLEYGV